MTLKSRINDKKIAQILTATIEISRKKAAEERGPKATYGENSDETTYQR